MDVIHTIEIASTHVAPMDVSPPSPEGRPGISDVSPPVWNLRTASLIPLFCISSLVLLPSRAAISVLSFSAFGPFS